MANINKVKAQGAIYDIEDSIARIAAGVVSQINNRVSSIETDLESISESIVSTEYVKVLTLKNTNPIPESSANSINFMSSTTLSNDNQYVVKISIDIPSTKSSKVYWRNSKNGNYNEVGVIPAGSTYFEASGSPTAEVNGFRVNNPTVGAYYTFVVERAVKRPVFDTIYSRLDALEENTDSFSHVDALIYKDRIPSYWFDKSKTPATYEEANTYLDGILEMVPEGKHFIFVTDTHWPKNAQHGNQIIQYVRGKLGVDKVIFGGDILNANDTKYLAKSVMSEYLNECVAAYGTSFLPVWGNHDLNTANDSTAGRLDLDVVSDLFVKHLNGVVQFEDYHNYGGMTGPTVDVITTIVDNKIAAIPSITTELGKTRDQIINDLLKYNKLHYYYDDHKNKVRYIVYNTGCPLNNVVKTFLGVQHNPEGYLQTLWMRDVLLSTPSGYDVIAVAHESVYSGDEHPDDMASSFYMKNMMAMMSALKRKISIKVWIDTSLATLIPTEWMPTGSVQCNFTNAPDVGKVILLCGHWHRDLAGIGSYGSSTGINDFKVPLVEDLTFSSPISVNQSELGEIPVVLTRCDKCWADNDTVDISGTTNEHSFDIVTLTDTDVVFTRVGWAISGTRQRIFTFV